MRTVSSERVTNYHKVARFLDENSQVRGWSADEIRRKISPMSETKTIQSTLKKMETWGIVHVMEKRKVASRNDTFYYKSNGDAYTLLEAYYEKRGEEKKKKKRVATVVKTQLGMAKIVAQALASHPLYSWRCV